MEKIKIENLSFSYPLSEKKAVDGVSVTVESGEIVLLCGRSGSGKTTLLRQLKKELAPHGEKAGRIFVDGADAEKMSLRESACKVGYVMQDPDSQLVTDKVWHELAFGLENLGFSKAEIRLRVAEIASYFGIDGWFDRKTAELSGGQKQILNLASVMAMSPEILLLDEPTSQLDPVAAQSFLSAVSRINSEFGTTVILTEQRLEEAFAMADRVLVMDEGRLIFSGAPEEAGKKLGCLPHFLQIAAPTAVRIFSRSGSEESCPVTVREGREWLEKTKHSKQFSPKIMTVSKVNAVELKNVYFRYSKNEKDVLKNLSLAVPEKSFFAVLGGNGAGKTTLIKVISGLLSPYEGKVRMYGKSLKKKERKTAVLPQDVKALFSSKSVLLELKQMNKDEEEILRTAVLTGTEKLLDRHPFDLSGGEQQRAALAKVLLSEPDILLLDEPTKGLDAEFKEDFAAIINRLKENGCTVIMISHDVEFCAKHADLCALLFDGEIAASSDTHSFFNTNRFYTTAARRMSRGIIDSAVTDEDIISCINTE